MAGESILIVEDNSSNSMLLKLTLTVEGYDVRTAANAIEAMEVLKNFQPKLIMMDIQLPGKDGLQLTRELKKHPKYQHIIIIALTAYAMKNDKQRILSIGCDGYMSKPIDVKTLAETIKSYLSITV